MEVLAPRLFQLQELWQDQGFTPDVTWQTERLESVLTALEQLIGKERWNRGLINASIEDLQCRIARLAEHLGHDPDLYLVPSQSLANISSYQFLSSLSQMYASVVEEVRHRENYVVDIFNEAEKTCTEIGLANPFPRTEVYTSAVRHLLKGGRGDPNFGRVDLSWAALRPLGEKLEHFRHERAERVRQFNVQVTRIRRLYLQLDHQPSDGLDDAITVVLERGFNQCPNGNQFYFEDETEPQRREREALEEAQWTWFEYVYEDEAHCLKINPKGLRMLAQRIRSLEAVKQRRHQRWLELRWQIERLYERLDWPEDDRMSFIEELGVTVEGISEIEVEFTRMQAFATARRWANLLDVADIEDIAGEVSDMSQLLGYGEEVYLGWNSVEQNGEPAPCLTDIRQTWHNLQNEIKARKKLIVSELEKIRSLTDELRGDLSLIPAVKQFRTDLSWANIRPMFAQQEALSFIKSERVRDFEQVCEKLYIVFKELSHPTRNPTLAALAKLFGQRKRRLSTLSEDQDDFDAENFIIYTANSKEEHSSEEDEGFIDAQDNTFSDLEAELQEIPLVDPLFITHGDGQSVGFYCYPLPYPLNLSLSCIHDLNELLVDLIQEKLRRQEWRINTICRLVRCYKKLEIPEDEWICKEDELVEDVRTATLEEMEQEKIRLEDEISRRNKLVQLQAAEIEDLSQRCNYMAELLGNPVELYVDNHLLPPLVEAREDNALVLKALVFDLQKEEDYRRDLVETAIQDVERLNKELLKSYLLPDISLYEHDLSWSNINPLIFTASELKRLRTRRIDAFEQHMSSLKEYRRALGYRNHDDLDEAVAELLDRLHDLPSEDVYPYFYQQELLPEKLILSGKCLSALAGRASWLRDECQRRKALKEKFLRGISKLYKELKIPEGDQIPIPEDYTDEGMHRLSVEYKRLKTLLHEHLVEIIERYKPELETLWNEAKVGPKGRENVMLRIAAAETAEEVENILVTEIEQLRFRLDKGAQILRMIEDRKQMIDRMLEFEKRASDPKRLFGNSKLLLEEDKWRKGAYPALKKLEEKMIKKILEYEEEKKAFFLVEDVRYLDLLDTEMSNRSINTRVFGITSPSPALRRPRIDTGTPDRSHSRQSSTSSMHMDRVKSPVTPRTQPAHSRSISGSTQGHSQTRSTETPVDAKPKQKVYAFGSSFVKDNTLKGRGISQSKSPTPGLPRVPEERALGLTERKSRPVDIKTSRKGRTTSRAPLGGGEMKLTPPDPDSPLLKADVGKLFGHIPSKLSPPSSDSAQSPAVAASKKTIATEVKKVVGIKKPPTAASKNDLPRWK